MADSSAKSNTNCHVRSNSFPSRSHPIAGNFEDHLRRLSVSKASTSSASSICSNLATIKDLHEGLDDLIQLPSTNLVLSAERGSKLAAEVLDGSLRMLDVCGDARDIIHLIRESVNELELSLRRNRGKNSSLAQEMDVYNISRKKITKMVMKSLKNLKQFEKICPSEDLNKDSIISMFRETEKVSLLVLKSILLYTSGRKDRSNKSWSLISKILQAPKSEQKSTNDLQNVNDVLITVKGDNPVAVQDTLTQLKTLAPAIQELEEGVEAVFRSLVKTRVSILNVLNH